MNIDDATTKANISASIVVGKIGTATASLEEIQQFTNNTNYIENKIKNIEEISKISQELKKQNKTIIFTNGCFDILHRGHCEYINKAKQLGDILIVGLNDDNSVTNLKGDNRPINNQEDRAYLLSSMANIDYIVIFSQDTPINLIKTIKPNILVKGSDYKNKKIIGSDIVDKIILIDFIDNKSTTNIINQIKQNCY
jgi:D-beta-D-heptose 7-phosphate kinase/D-beta-D-heptose 1-phosphate adenosyltransferase